MEQPSCSSKINKKNDKINFTKCKIFFCILDIKLRGTTDQLAYYKPTFLLISVRIKYLALRSKAAFIHGSIWKLDGRPGAQIKLKEKIITITNN